MLIFGFGYTAKFIAKKLLAINFDIAGTTRDISKLGFNHELGVELVNFAEADVKQQLQSATHVLVSTPPVAALGDPVLANFIELIKKHAPNMLWLGYLSSTGVYGDHHGDWVDESSASINLGQQGQLRLNAENAWLSLAKQHQLPLHIFRIAGIYGPQRNALTRIASGKTETIYKENHFFSRIHVDDIAAIILASIQNPNPISIYNLADNEPAPSYNVDEYAASLLGVTAIKRVLIEDATLSPMANEFYTHHRRVGNAKIKRELFITLTFPTYREGLNALYAAGEGLKK
jgi:nucleoside-diphosphate-sugar epimerase